MGCVIKKNIQSNFSSFMSSSCIFDRSYIDNKSHNDTKLRVSFDDIETIISDTDYISEQPKSISDRPDSPEDLDNNNDLYSSCENIMKSARRVTGDLNKLESQLKQSLVMGEFTDSESDGEINSESIYESSYEINSKSDSKSDSESAIGAISSESSNSSLNYSSKSSKESPDSDGVLKEESPAATLKDMLFDGLSFSDSLIRSQNLSNPVGRREVCTQTNESMVSFDNSIGSIDGSIDLSCDMSFSYEAGILLSGRFDDYMRVPVIYSPKKSNKKSNKKDHSMVFCEQYFKESKSPKSPKSPKRFQEIKSDDDSGKNNKPAFKPAFKSDFSESVMMNVGNALLRQGR